MKTIREYIDLIESAQAPLAENTGRSLDNAHQRAVIKINKMLKDPSISPVRRAELEQWKKEQMASMKMARGASIIPKNKLPLPEQGVAEGEGGLGQVAGIGINGKQFNFSIKDLIAKAQNYPIKKLNPQLFVKQLADRHEDPKQTAARAQAADLQYPIIVVQDGNTLMIADGTHRAQKAIMNKLPSINAYVIPVEDMAEFSKQGVTEGEISQQYTVAVDCGEDGTFTVKVHAGDKGEALRKAQKIVRNEYDTYPEGARIVGQGVAEALSKTDLLKQVSAELNNPEFRKQPADPTKSFTRGDHWQGAKPGDYGYTGYQGHGMPTDRAERARIRADKKKQQDK